MKHEGPDPSEAIPADEDTLTTEEFDMLSDFLMGARERAPGADEEPLELSPENEAVIRELSGRAAGRAFESLKASIIEHREE